MREKLGDLVRATGSLVRPFVAAVAVAGLALLWSGTPVMAATVQVTTSADENGTGAACSLREAVAAVNAGSNGTGGCVATGTYGTDDRITFAAATNGAPILLANGEITITRGVQIVGNGATSTIIDGQKGTPSATRVLQVNGGITVGISGLTIRNGSTTTDGGGINNGGTLTVANSTLSGNAANAFGGGIFNSGGATLTVTGSILSGNVAATGGGIQNHGTLTMTGSTLSSNAATFFGGGINNNGTLTVTGSTFNGNSVASYGGGINNTGTATVTSSTLSSNQTNLFGGGIYNNGTLTVTSSTLNGNSASLGGGIFHNIATLTVINSTLSGNSATGFGGGIFNESATLTVINSTLSGNSATSSGGISSSGSSTATLRASVLDTGASGNNCFGSITSLGSNVADDTSCRLAANGDRQVADGAILLGPLANNGGPTQTHALLPGSPAIDAVPGPCTSTGLPGGTTIATDQRGRSRPAGARCDAGAHEFSLGTLSFSAPTFTVGEGDGSAIITVTRSGGTEGSVGATVSSANGTAVAPGDYTAAAPTVSFADGDTASKTVSIGIVNDALDEPNETVALTLGSPTGGVAIGPQASAVLTILDNDPVPAVSVANVSVAEGNAGQSTATFTVSLTNPTAQQITVAYATADGTSTAGSDYTATSGTLTFAPGETSKPIPVTILGDTLSEPDETFTVTLANPTNATLGAGQAIGTIRNDDAVVACTPRPRVTTSLQAGGGALAVHVAATPLNTQQSNPLQQIRFGAFQNATVTMNGQAVASGQTVTLPANMVAADFSVARVTAGQPTTVSLTVVDGCGSWQTFVGGGTSAGF